MKIQITTLLSATLLAALLIVNPAVNAGNHREMMDDPILILPVPPIPEGGPRTPVFNPFYAELEGNYVLLGSSSSYGEVSVTLSSTAGDYYQTVFDTEDGYILIPISGDSGHYTLTLVAENGQVYEGRFVL